MKRVERTIQGCGFGRISRRRTFDELINNVFDWFDEHDLHDPVMQMVKVQEEVGEIAHEISRNHLDSDELVDALGDSFVTLIGMCHHLDIDPTTALLKAYNEIKDRKGGQRFFRKGRDATRLGEDATRRIQVCLL